MKKLHFSSCNQEERGYNKSLRDDNKQQSLRPVPRPLPWLPTRSQRLQPRLLPRPSLTPRNQRKRRKRRNQKTRRLQCKLKIDNSLNKIFRHFSKNFGHFSKNFGQKSEKKTWIRFIYIAKDLHWKINIYLEIHIVGYVLFTYSIPHLYLEVKNCALKWESLLKAKKHAIDLKDRNHVFHIL